MVAEAGVWLPGAVPQGGGEGTGESGEGACGEEESGVDLVAEFAGEGEEGRGSGVRRGHCF